MIIWDEGLAIALQVMALVGILGSVYILYEIYWGLKSKIYWDKDGLHCGYCGTSVQIIESTPEGFDAVIELFGLKHRRCAKKYRKLKE